MNHSTRLAVLHTAALFGLTCTLAAQTFKLDSIHYDGFAGLAQLRWESQPGRIYSLHSSTNLTTWEEVTGNGLQPLRIPAATGSRTQVELEVPSGNRRIWRVGLRPVTVLESPISGGYPAALSDVNDSGRVVGHFNTRSQSPVPYGFTWAPGEGLVSFGASTAAVAVNASGTVVGYNTSTHKFFSWTKTGGMVERGSGAAVDINEAGHILGYDRGLGGNAFLWKPTTGKMIVPHLSSAQSGTVPVALSDAGHVVGGSLIDGNYYRAFLWTESGGVVDLTATLSTAASGAVDVNSSGQVVGYRTIAGGSTRAFSWTAGGGFVTFPAEYSIADLNENGKVVGSFVAGPRRHAFSWTQAGGMIDLGEGQPEQVNELGQMVGYAGAAAVWWSPTGGRTELEALSPQQSTANLINNHGVIFGTSQLPSNGAHHVVMWTTNPAP